MHYIPPLRLCLFFSSCICGYLSWVHDFTSLIINLVFHIKATDSAHGQNYKLYCVYSCGIIYSQLHFFLES